MSTIKDKYDVIIIGAGISGLTAAVELAQKHLNVLVVEKNTLPGGLATTHMLGDYEFEPILHHMINVGSPEEPGSVRNFFKRNNIHISWLPTPNPIRIEVPNEGIYLTMPQGYDNVANAIEEIEPGSYKKVMEFFNLCENIFLSQAELFNFKISGFDILSKHKDYLTSLNHTLEDALNQWNFSQRVKNILTSFFFYFATPADKFPFTVYACFIANFLRGTYVNEGFGYHIVLALAEKAETYGVDFLYGDAVSKIYVKGNKARGIKLESGSYINSKYIISGAQITNVYRKMISYKKINKGTVKRLNARTLGYSSFDVLLILDQKPNELGIFDYSVFNGTTLDSKIIVENSNCEKFTSYYNSVCLNYANPNATKDDTTMLSLSAIVHPTVFENMDYDSYEKFKEARVRELLERESERIGCDLYNHILEIKVLTPIDYAHKNGSYRGNVFGFMQTMDDHLIARAATNDKENKIKNLFFANSCGLYGGGIPNGMMTSCHIANEILKDLEDKRHEN